MLNAESVVLVDPTISRTKLSREIEHWIANAAHRERGWVLLRHDIDALTVELAFLGKVSISTGSTPLPVVACAIRLYYDNYDLWPPSLTFIDPFSGDATLPHVRAFMALPDGPRDVLIDAHPLTGRPFLCFAGIREYHSHPQHTGDSWMLHRAAGEGSLATICDRVWRYMVRNVVGLRLEVQGLPTVPLQARLVVVLAQGDVAVHAVGVAAEDGSVQPEAG